MPLYATLFVIAMLSSVGLPGLNGFVGEFLILAGSFKTHPRWTVVAATGVILAAIYLLWLIQSVFYGPITKEENRSIREIAWNEVLTAAAMLVTTSDARTIRPFDSTSSNFETSRRSSRNPTTSSRRT